jgi:tRNA-dihydrouridine synthase B
VTLKIRTGTSPHERNATTIARIAQEAGIAALTIHGRTKACAFKGAVEYDTIAEVVSRVEIPVIANGDITHPDQALKVLNYTGAAGIMVGRGAQGQPWLLGQIKHKWRTGEGLNAPSRETKLHIAYQHVAAIHEFYGDFMGLRFARKHAGWYFESMNLDRSVRSRFNQIQHPQEQLDFIQQLTATLRQDAA